ncbi:MAG: hypothetical protein ACFFBR_06760 [Promethearchaeota archaeon]
MQDKAQEPSTRTIFRVRLLGVFSVLLGISYIGVALLGLTVASVDLIILIVGSLILVFGFAIYRTLQIEKQVEKEISRGRNFFGCGVGLLVAFLLGASAFLLMGIDQFSDFLTVNRWESLFLIPSSFFTFFSAALSFYLGSRYHQLIERSFFVEGELFLTVGIPSLAVIVLLIILSQFAWGPASDILSIIVIALTVLFFVIFIFSAILNKEAPDA